MGGNFIQSSIMRNGTDFSLQRDGQVIAVVKGISNREDGTQRAYIGVLPDSGVTLGDVLLNPAGDKHYVVEVKTQFIRSTPAQLKAYYRTEQEMNQSVKSGGDVYNVQNAHNVIIGGGNQTVDYGNAVVGNQGAVNYASSGSTLGELRELLQPYMEDYKDDIDRLLEIVQKIENGTVRVDKSVFSPVKALIALIPVLGPFLKKKFPTAFDT